MGENKTYTYMIAYKVDVYKQVTSIVSKRIGEEVRTGTVTIPFKIRNMSDVSKVESIMKNDGHPDLTEIVAFSLFAD